MLAIFCLRLATGMIAALLLLSPAQVNPRFFRTHFLTAFALTALAIAFLWDAAGVWLWMTAVAVMFLAALGSITWMLEGAPGGRMLMLLTLPLLLAALVQTGYCVRPEGEPWWLVIDDLTAAAMLGSATT